MSRRNETGNTRLKRGIEALKSSFSNAADKHAAHRAASPILEDLAGDPLVFSAILENHVTQPNVLSQLHYPVIGIHVELNAHFGLVANCWIPLPDGRNDVSTKAIHHHGNMLLTTVTSFGPGYEHWTFAKPSLLEEERELFTMDLIERGQHGLHHTAFVDAFVAHVPLYPSQLSVTMALWSSQFPATWKDRLKRLPFLRGREDELRRWGVRLGLAEALDLKVVEYFDFCPTADGFKGIRERSEFERGPNADYLQSLLHVVQRTGNEALLPLLRARVDTVPAQNTELFVELLRKLESGAVIEPRLSAGHYNRAEHNFAREQIVRALEIQRRENRLKAGLAQAAG